MAWQTAREDRWEIARGVRGEERPLNEPLVLPAAMLCPNDPAADECQLCLLSGEYPRVAKLSSLYIEIVEELLRITDNKIFMGEVEFLADLGDQLLSA